MAEQLPRAHLEVPLSGTTSLPHDSELSLNSTAAEIPESTGPKDMTLRSLTTADERKNNEIS
jgi:hypothetical protein